MWPLLKQQQIREIKAREHAISTLKDIGMISDNDGMLDRRKVLKQGVIDTRNEENVWEKQFAVLHGTSLFIYAQSGDKEPRSVLSLDVCTLDLDYGDIQKVGYIFELQTPVQLCTVRAKHKAAFIEWILAIGAYYQGTFNRLIAFSDNNTLLFFICNRYSTGILRR